MKRTSLAILGLVLAASPALAQKPKYTRNSEVKVDVKLSDRTKLSAPKPVDPKSPQPALTADDVLSIEGLVGGPERDALIGNGRSNTLVGLGGDDRLFGLGRPDALAGGAGADDLFGGRVDDVVRALVAVDPLATDEHLVLLGHLVPLCRCRDSSEGQSRI